MFVKNTEEYNPNKKRKILIAFDDMIADPTDTPHRIDVNSTSILRR